MKINLVLTALPLLAGSLLAADSSKDDITSAAKNLTSKGNYSWKTTVDAGGGGGGGGGRFRPGPTDGKADKDGTIFLSMTRGENTIEAVLKGSKGALKTQDGWKSLSEAAEEGGDQPGPGRFLARTLQNFKAPATEAEDLANKAKDLKKSDEAYTGDLTEEGVKQIFARGPRRPGGEAPSPSNAKGSVKFWLKDGTLSKYQYNVQGTMEFNGNEVNINRTTTVEIKDVGTTKVSVPEEAKKKLS